MLPVVMLKAIKLPKPDPYIMNIKTVFGESLKTGW